MSNHKEWGSPIDFCGLVSFSQKAFQVQTLAGARVLIGGGIFPSTFCPGMPGYHCALLNKIEIIKPFEALQGHFSSRTFNLGGGGWGGGEDAEHLPGGNT